MSLGIMNFTKTLSKQMEVNQNKVFAELPQDYKVSPEQFKFYDDNGYLVINGLVDFTTLYACKQRFSKICKGVVEKGKIVVVKDQALVDAGAKGEDCVNKIQAILYDDVLSGYTEYPRLLDVVRQFIGQDITAIHGMFINKPPNTSRHPTHQDMFYFPYRPAEKIIGAWTAVDDITLENGCLYVVPGSHKQETIHPHGNLNDATKLYHGLVLEPQLSPESSRVHLSMSPGDTVLLHPLLLHGSNPNVSKRYRKAITCHYVSKDCYLIDPKDTVQRELSEEIERVMREKGFNISYNDLWRYQSRDVANPKSKL